MATGAIENENQHVYGDSEENKNLTEKNFQKPDNCNAETKKAETNNVEEC